MPQNSIKIIITSYENPDYLIDSIKSLQNQTHTEFSALIIDDASNCDVEPTVHQLIKNDHRFEFKRNHCNLGGPITFMLNAANINEKYLLWLHHDDWLHNSFLEQSFNALEQNADCTFSYSLCSRVTNGVVKNEFPSCMRPQLDTGPHDISFDSVINCWVMWSCALIRTSSYRSIGGLEYFYQKYKHRNIKSVYRMGEADLYIFAKLSSLGNAFVINDRLCYYRDHGGSNTNNALLKSTHIQDNIRTYDYIFDEIDFFSDPIRIMAKINSAGRLSTGTSLPETAYKILYTSHLSAELLEYKEKVLIGLLKSMHHYILDSEVLGYPMIFSQNEIKYIADLIMRANKN
jgi:glycosyltransferase involved in cell wall biosynthesis